MADIFSIIITNLILIDSVHFQGPVETSRNPYRIEEYLDAQFCPTINGLVIECLTELRKHTCSLARSDMVSALNAMLKDVLPVSLVTNLRLEGKTLKEFFCDTRMLTQLDSKKDLHSIGHNLCWSNFLTP